MLAPNPDAPDLNGVDLTESAEIADVRSVLRDTLKKLKGRSKTARLNEDSRLFRLKAKLTEVACAEDVDRRRAYLKEAGVPVTRSYDAVPAATGSDESVIPDATPDA